MPNRYLPLAAALALALIQCNSGSDSGGGGSGFTAKVDGKAWESGPNFITAQTNAGVTGLLSIIGTQSDGTNSSTLHLTFYNVRGPGKYPLGVGGEVIGGIGQYGEGTGGGNSNSWITPNSGVAGMAEITAVGGGRVVGTFTYTAEPGSRNTLGVNRVITEGKFNVPLTGDLTPLAENVGSRLSAELNGVHYNAWGINASLKDFNGNPGVTISTTTGMHGISLSLVGVTDAGTFTLDDMPPQRSISAGHNTGSPDCCWQSANPGSSGEIVITSLTAQRVKGTFKATLKPTVGKPATTDLNIVGGEFDVGILP